MAFYHLQIGALVVSGIRTKPNPALTFLFFGHDWRADPTGDSSDEGQRDASSFGDALSRIGRLVSKIRQRS
jgi:hypothetical protein